MSLTIRTKAARWITISLAAILFALGAIPVQAEEAKTEIRLKVGSNQMKINGEAVTIQAPYQSAGSVMVPLSVFTNKQGFGAKVQLTDNKGVKLAYGTHAIVFTVNSKTANVDGKKTLLPVAPAVKQGVTMVPLAIFAKSFGATMAKDSSTQELVLKFVPIAGNNGGGKAIDADAGKSKIGDSYYGWTMNYPTGLSMSDQSQDGGLVIFQDVKKEYYLAVIAEEAKQGLTRDEKRDIIYRYLEETEKVVDKKTVGSGSSAYERIITKDKGGFFYEYRGIQANGYFYTTIYGNHVKSAQELIKSSGILDSFRTSFNRSDASIKDLTRIIDGFKTFTDEDYGLTVKLPKEWKQDTEASVPWYYLEENVYLYLDVTSVVSGDTLEDWIKRKTTRFEQTFAPAYRKAPEVKSVVWNGIPAKLMKLSYSWDTVAWWEEYEIFATRGDYRYYTELAYETGKVEKAAELLDMALRTMKVDFSAVESNFGEIEDDADNADRSALVTRTSEKYGYKITMPQFWTGEKKNLEEPEAIYSATGVGVGVDYWADETYTLSELSSLVDDYYRDKAAKVSKYKVVEKTTVQFAGFTAIKVIIEDFSNKDNSPFRGTEYYILKGDKVYNVWGTLYVTNASDFNAKSLEDALNSFAFTR